MPVATSVPSNAPPTREARRVSGLPLIKTDPPAPLLPLSVLSCIDCLGVYRMESGLAVTGAGKVFHVFSAQRSGILLRSIDLAGLRGGPLRRNFGRRAPCAPIKCRDCTHWKITAYPVGFSAADGVCLSPGGVKSDWRYSAYAMSLNQALSAGGTDTHNRHTAFQKLARPRLLHLYQVIDSIGIFLS